MRRRVARVVRRALFVLGTILLCWLPFSFPLQLQAQIGFEQGAMASVVLEDGAVDVFVDWEPGPPQPSFAELYWSFDEPDWRVVVPDAEVIPRRIWLSIPLWLLAFICLAWPVTSFIIARRRHKRGFPVSVAPLPLGEVPSEVASGDRDEAERASARTS